MRNPGPSILHVLDIPCFRDHDSGPGPGYYIAACGTLDPWKGCAVYRSVDAGMSYALLARVTKAAVLGSAIGALASGPISGWDEANIVQVTVRGQLESYSEPNAPLVLIGSEILRYQDADLVSSRGSMTTYELSMLQRGLKGTEDAVGTHVAGDRFVLLDDAVLRIFCNVEDLGVAQLFKAVTSNTLITAASPVPFANTGRHYY